MYGLRSDSTAKSTAELIKDINSLSNSTSYFSKQEQRALRFQYNDTNDLNMYLPPNIVIPNDSPLYIQNKEYSSFIGCSNVNYNSIIELPDKDKQFALLLDQVALNEVVVRGTDESKTDTFVDYVLREVGLGNFPLAIRLKPIYAFDIRHKTITSEYDFSIQNREKLLMVEEDKHIRNTGPASSWGEYQLAGEIIAGAYDNYRKCAVEGDIFAIRAIGPRFTFYHTIIPATYITSLSVGLPEESIMIQRYPPQADTTIPPGFNYTNSNERRLIIDMLYIIKHKLLSI